MLTSSYLELRLLEGLFRAQLSGPHAESFSDSISLRAGEFAPLTSSQKLLMLLVPEPHFENH